MASQQSDGPRVAGRVGKSRAWAGVKAPQPDLELLLPVHPQHGYQWKTSVHVIVDTYALWEDLATNVPLQSEIAYKFSCLKYNLESAVGQRVE